MFDLKFGFPVLEFSKLGNQQKTQKCDKRDKGNEHMVRLMQPPT